MQGSTLRLWRTTRQLGMLPQHILLRPDSGANWNTRGLHACRKQLTDACVCTEAGEYAQALQDYKAAGDAASIVRILLGPLQRPDSAADMARHSGNEAALRQVADHMLAVKQPQVCSLPLYCVCAHPELGVTGCHCNMATGQLSRYS